MPLPGRSLRRALGRGFLALALLLAAASALPAQRAPRLLLSVGGGSVPRDDGDVAHGRVAGVTAAAGARVPLWRAAYVEGLVQAQGALDFNDDLTLASVPDGVGGRTLGTVATGRDAGSGVAVLARAGAERTGDGGRRPAFRVAAGLGAMRAIRGPLATVSAGISSPGRRARLALDADGWWYRTDATESRLAPPSLGVPATLSRRVRVRLRSTFLRLGVEVPLDARGR